MTEATIENKLMDQNKKTILHLENNKEFTLWSNYVDSIRQLEVAGLVRSNRIVPDFAELIVEKLTNGEICHNKVHKHYDVTCKKQRIQVKSINKHRTNKAGFNVSTKDVENTQATHYAYVYFNDTIPDVVYIVKTSFLRKKYAPSGVIRRQHLEEAVKKKQAIRYEVNLSSLFPFPTI